MTLLVKEVGHVLNHVVVDVAVSCECAGAFGVAGEFADEVGVLDFFVEVPDEGSACHVRA